MITADELRQQAKAHREAASKLDAAASAMDTFGHSSMPTQRKVEVASLKRARPQGLVISDGVRKNQDLCFQALKAAGHPLPVKELMQAIGQLGSAISNPNTVTVYLRADEKNRFFRPSNGVWALKDFQAKSQ